MPLSSRELVRYWPVIAAALALAMSLGVMYQKIEFNIQLTQENREAIKGLSEKLDRVIITRTPVAKGEATDIDN